MTIRASSFHTPEAVFSTLSPHWQRITKAPSGF